MSSAGPSTSGSIAAPAEPAGTSGRRGSRTPDALAPGDGISHSPELQSRDHNCRSLRIRRTTSRMTGPRAMRGPRISTPSIVHQEAVLVESHLPGALEAPEPTEGTPTARVHTGAARTRPSCATTSAWQWRRDPALTWSRAVTVVCDSSRYRRARSVSFICSSQTAADAESEEANPQPDDRGRGKCSSDHPPFACPPAPPEIGPVDRPTGGVSDVDPGRPHPACDAKE